MKKPNSTKIFYYLNIDDIQNVANEEIERDLTNTEIAKLLDPIAEKINWYDAIAYSINEMLDPHSAND